MSKNTLFLVAVFIGAAVLSFLLSRSGCHSSKSKLETEKISQEIPEHPNSNNAENEPADTKKMLNDAFKLVYTDGDIMGGVGKYKQVLELDSNNVEALYQLGMLSIKSNQLEKAEIRFKKLILLQPENQEYKDQYNLILEQLGTN